jgi:outer membrane biosynthesis protein TonB
MGQSPRVLSQMEVKGASTNQFGATGCTRSSTAQQSAVFLSAASVTEPDKTDKSKIQGSTEHPETAEKPPMVPTLRNIGTDSSEQPVPTPAAVNPLRQGGNIDPPERIVGKNPAYPPLAKQSHITGIVEVHFRVSVEGRVYDVHAVKGSPCSSKLRSTPY